MRKFFRFIVIFIFVISIHCMKLKNVEDEDFPFLVSVDEDTKKQFTEILFSWNTTFNQKMDLLDSWASRQSDVVKIDYEEWKDEAKKFIEIMKTLHQKKTANYSIEAKQADNKFVEIWQNDNLTPQQKCQEFIQLYTTSSEAVRKEAHLPLPSNLNCTELSQVALKTFDIDNN